MTNARYIFLVCGLLADLATHAQYDGSVPQVTTVTPNAAALFKVTQRPQGSYTGTTPIQIPLYQVTAGSLSVPVTLSYANGGIRVEEIASWVGLGFSISAGGRITRVMNGVPDDDITNGGMLHASLKPSGFPGNPQVSNLSDVVAGNLDMEPDMYYFDCNGISGKFFFDESGEPHIVSQQPIKIEKKMMNNVIKGWIITDQSGNKYYFGMNGEQTVNYVDYTNLLYTSALGYSIPNPSPVYISSWHLAEIKDMSSENAIKFTYVSSWSSFYTLSSAYKPISGVWGLDCSPNEGFGDEIFVTNETNEYILTKIEGGVDSIIFRSSSNRLDFSGGRKLDEVSLYARNNQFIKAHKFHYGYFSKPGESGGDNQVKRLKLSKLVEVGDVLEDSLTHTFEYIESVNLPRRDSRAVDYWGYYNGKDNNSTFMPNGKYYYLDATYQIDNLADRRAFPQFSIANTLKKIIYPTGGYREFIYEGNQVLLREDSQIGSDDSNVTFAGFSEEAVPFVNSYTPVINKTFTIDSDEGTASFTFFLHFNSIIGNMDVTVKIIRVYAVGDYEIMSFYGQEIGDWILDNGNYRIEVYQGNDTEVAVVQCHWPELHQSDNLIGRYGGAYRANNNNAGGVRVKSVSDYDPISGKTNTTSYLYNLFSDPSLTSGLLVSPVRMANIGGCDNRDCRYLKLSGQSTYPLAAQNGSYVVYSEVRTIEEGNGYADRTYTFALDGFPVGGYMYDFPITPQLDASWKRGKLQEEKVYNNDGQLLKETYYDGNGWSIDSSNGPYNENSQIGWKVVGYFQPNVVFCYRDYILTSQFTNVEIMRERIYDPVTGTFQERLTEYDYHIDNGYPLLKEEKVMLNNGTVRSTNYRYAFNAVGDFTFGLIASEQSIKNTLNARHYWQPLEIVVTETPDGGTTKVTGGAKYAFGIFAGSKIHLANLKQFTSATDYRETIFSSYDSRGNLQEKYQVGGPREVYLWGYYGTYPVAKILGSSYTTVSAWVTSSILNNPASDATLRTHLNAIRTNLNSGSVPAQVSTYTYKPLVGMTSETDAKGLIRYYEYDHFHRLNAEKDNNGNLVRSIQYHYKQ
ncbi:hypothetical protein [Parapedobacter tibetensis]|uniref:hypothetical protein n=1 Tax=Parapedobacter tibetensis TaxID=2972951 RepID=UPI00214D2CAA|nr:hypothetical protein [Parapedobacter tibetensis]